MSHVEYAIQCRGLWKSYDATTVVCDLHLSVRAGKITSLLGPSGCGKTTVLRIIAGLEIADRGTIEIGGRVVARERSYVPPERRQIGMVFQDFALFPHLSVAENIAYGLPPHSPDRAGR